MPHVGCQGLLLPMMSVMFTKCSLCRDLQETIKTKPDAGFVKKGISCSFANGSLSQAGVYARIVLTDVSAYCYQECGLRCSQDPTRLPDPLCLSRSRGKRLQFHHHAALVLQYTVKGMSAGQTVTTANMRSFSQSAQYVNCQLWSAEAALACSSYAHTTCHHCHAAS